MVQEVPSFGPDGHLAAQGIFGINAQVLVRRNACFAPHLAAGLNGETGLDAAAPFVKDMTLRLERGGHKHVTLLLYFRVQVGFGRMAVMNKAHDVPVPGIPCQLGIHIQGA